MHTILHLAVTQDGYIARSNGDSSWVSHADEELFMARARDAGCLVVGRTTFEQYRGTIYPVSGALNIVLTADVRNMQLEERVVIATSPEEAISIAQKRGMRSMLIAGGAKVARAFLDRGLINEIFLSVHPFRLGEGIKAFEDIAHDARFILKGEREPSEGLKELRYVMI